MYYFTIFFSGVWLYNVYFELRFVVIFVEKRFCTFNHDDRNDCSSNGACHPLLCYTC